MIQSIKTLVNVEEDENERELCIDYADDSISFYLDNKFLFSMDYENNFKEVINKILENGETKK